MADNTVRDRKYKTFWAVFLSSAVLLVFDKLNGAEYVQVLIFTFGLYMAGNVGEHASKAYENKGKADEQENQQQDRPEQKQGGWH